MIKSNASSSLLDRYLSTLETCGGLAVFHSPELCWSFSCSIDFVLPLIHFLAFSGSAFFPTVIHRTSISRSSFTILPFCNQPYAIISRSAAAMAPLSEDQLGEKVDRCFADSLLKISGGVAIGIVASVAFFKVRRANIF